MEGKQNRKVPLFQVRVQEGERDPSALASLLRLDVWGTMLLTARAKAEMDVAALLLAVIACFELTAWWLLMRTIVNAAASGDTSVTASVGAFVLPLALALVYASAVLIYERSFLTLDLSTGGNRFAVAFIVRLLAIAAAAYATSRPVEQLVFGGEIWKCHASQVEAQESVVADELKSALAKINTDLSSELSATSGAAIVGYSESLVDGIAERAVQMDKERALASHATAEEERLKKRKKTCESKTEADRVADPSCANIDGRIDQEHRSASDHALKSEEARAAMRGLQDAPNSGAVRGTESRNSSMNAIANIAKSEQREAAELEHAILAKRKAHPPGYVESEINLRLYKDGLCPPLGGGETAEIRSAIGNSVGWAALIAAMFIPLLTVGYKFMIGQELSAYYSLASQARAGNPEAGRVLRAMGQPVPDPDDADDGEEA